MDCCTANSRCSSPEGDITEIAGEKRGDTAAAAAVLSAVYGCVTLGAGPHDAGPSQIRQQ